MSELESTQELKRATWFVIMTYAGTWIIWFFTPFLELIGSCIPSIIGILFLLKSRTDMRENLRKRILSFKLIRKPWYFIIVLSMPLIMLLSYITQKSLGGEVPSLDVLSQNLRNPLLILTFLILGLGAGLGEEFGWRAFLLETLQKRWNPFTSSLIIGFFWMSWHIPLGVLSGDNLLSPKVLSRLLFIFTLSILMTWVYNNNRRSILSVIILHCMVNFTVYIFGTPIPPEMYLIMTLYLALFITGVIAVSRKKPPLSFCKVDV